jgi:hypothetical protein
VQVLVVGVEERVGVEPAPVEQELPVVEQEGDVAGQVEEQRRRGEQRRDQQQGRRFAEAQGPARLGNRDPLR